MEPEMNQSLKEFSERSRLSVGELQEKSFEMAFDEGDKLFTEGQFSEAYQVYQHLLETITLSSQQPSLKLAQVYQKLGRTCLKKADYQTACDFLTKSLCIATDLDDQDLFFITQIHMDIGEVLFAQGKYTEAHERFQNSLGIIEEKYKEKYCEHAICYNNLAKIAEEEGKYNEALVYLDKAIKASERRNVDKDKSPELMKSYFRMASVNESLANYSLAHKYAEKARIMSEVLFGISHSETASCYNLIGVLYQDQGKHTKALENYKKALDIRLQSLGPTHPRVADCHNNIGTIYYELDNYDEALKHYKNSLEINKIVQGEAHPDVATGYNNIASVYSTQNRYKEALEYYQKALDIRVQAYGENHPDVAMSYRCIGLLYLEQNDDLRAQSSFEKSLKITLECFGPQHPETAKVFNDMGSVLQHQLKHKEALVWYLKSLRIAIEDFYESSDVAWRFYNANVLFKKVGDERLAENFSRRSYKIYQKSLGKMHRETQSSRNQIFEKQQRSSLLNVNNNFII